MPSLIGTWYLNANQSRFTLEFMSAGSPNQYVGELFNDSGGVETVDNITFDSSNGTVDFRRVGVGFWQWYHAIITEGVLAGRFSHDPNSPVKPPLGSAYAFHVTGWNSDYFDTDIAPRVFDVVVNTNFRATLRIDSDSSANFIGRLKFYASSNGNGWSAAGEELEDDLEVTAWDGVNLSFIRHLGTGTQTYNGAVAGRTISGTFTDSRVSGGLFPWQGSRSNVFTYGLAPKTPAQRSDWQVRIRLQIQRLIMQGDPAVTVVSVTNVTQNALPFPDGALFGTLDRDDNPAGSSRNYTLNEFAFDYSLQNPYGPDPINRKSHAWLSVPNAPPPASGYRAVLAVNGHPGVRGVSSAHAMMDPTDGDYWYGEAFARRGFVVLALDISHRPPADSMPLYNDFPNGNDPLHGNGPHPAIQANELPNDTDWEEDGERVWDAFRALDLLTSGQLNNVQIDPAHLLVTGLSLGGEMATIIGALDTRLSIAIPAGFCPDLNLLKFHGNHTCWQWKYADICEYLDISDYHSLVAPRALIVQTGSADTTFSDFNPPFASDKQIIRRTRVAFADQPDRFLHYLQPHQNGELVHQYRVGDLLSIGLPAVGVQVPTAVAPPTGQPWSQAWQTDSNTQNPSVPGHPVPTLFDCIDNL